MRRVFVAAELQGDLEVVAVKVVPVLHASVHLVPLGKRHFRRNLIIVNHRSSAKITAVLDGSARSP